MFLHQLARLELQVLRHLFHLGQRQHAPGRFRSKEARYVLLFYAVFAHQGLGLTFQVCRHPVHLGQFRRHHRGRLRRGLCRNCRRRDRRNRNRRRGSLRRRYDLCSRNGGRQLSEKLAVVVVERQRCGIHRFPLRHHMQHVFGAIVAHRCQRTVQHDAALQLREQPYRFSTRLDLAEFRAAVGAAAVDKATCPQLRQMGFDNRALRMQIAHFECFIADEPGRQVLIYRRRLKKFRPGVIRQMGPIAFEPAIVATTEILLTLRRSRIETPESRRICMIAAIGDTVLCSFHIGQRQDAAAGAIL